MRRGVYSAILLFALFAGGEAIAAAQGKAEHFRLANGLEALIVPGKPNGIAVHMVWYKIGAADEKIGKTGLAHYMEHMMFRRREDEEGKSGRGDFSSRIAAWGGRSNAWTSKNETVYYEQIPAARLEQVMALEAARMGEFDALPASALAERNVVLEERRLRRQRSPTQIFYERMLAALFGANHPYGRPVIGAEEDIAALTLEDLRRFHRAYYQPARALVVVGGDVDTKAAKAAIKQHYGALPAHRAAIESFPERTRPAGPQHFIHEDASVRRPALYRFYLLPKGEAGVDEPVAQEAARDLMIEILGGSETSRLSRVLVLEKKLAVSAGVWSDSAGRGPGMIGISLTPAPGVALAELEAALDEVLAEFKAEGAEAGEIARGKTLIKAGVLFARDKSFSYTRGFGSLVAAGRDIGYFQRWLEGVEASPPEQIRAAAQRWLVAERAVTGLLTAPKNP